MSRRNNELRRAAVRPGFVFRPSNSSGATKRSAVILCCEQQSLAALAKRYGTPLYIYSANAILDRLSGFQKAFSEIPHTICYSVKANSNLSILRLLTAAGCGFDVVSGGELERVTMANRRAVRQVVFSGVGKSREEISTALKAGILLFNVESESELLALSECGTKLRTVAPRRLARESRCSRRNSSLYFYRTA